MAYTTKSSNTRVGALTLALLAASCSAWPAFPPSSPPPLTFHSSSSSTSSSSNQSSSSNNFTSSDAGVNFSASATNSSNSSSDHKSTSSFTGSLNGGNFGNFAQLFGGNLPFFNPQAFAGGQAPFPGAPSGTAGNEGGSSNQNLPPAGGQGLSSGSQHPSEGRQEPPFSAGSPAGNTGSPPSPANTPKASVPGTSGSGNQTPQTNKHSNADGLKPYLPDAQETQPGSQSRPGSSPVGPQQPSFGPQGGAQDSANRGELPAGNDGSEINNTPSEDYYTVLETLPHFTTSVGPGTEVPPPNAAFMPNNQDPSAFDYQDAPLGAQGPNSQRFPDNSNLNPNSNIPVQPESPALPPFSAGSPAPGSPISQPGPQPGMDSAPIGPQETPGNPFDYDFTVGDSETAPPSFETVNNPATLAGLNPGNLPETPGPAPQGSPNSDLPNFQAEPGQQDNTPATFNTQGIAPGFDTVRDAPVSNAQLPAPEHQQPPNNQQPGAMHGPPSGPFGNQGGLPITPEFAVGIPLDTSAAQGPIGNVHGTPSVVGPGLGSNPSSDIPGTTLIIVDPEGKDDYGFGEDSEVTYISPADPQNPGISLHDILTDPQLDSEVPITNLHFSSNPQIPLDNQFASTDTYNTYDVAPTRSPVSSNDFSPAIANQVEPSNNPFQPTQNQITSGNKQLTPAGNQFSPDNKYPAEGNQVAPGNIRSPAVNQPVPGNNKVQGEQIIPTDNHFAPSSDQYPSEDQVAPTHNQFPHLNDQVGPVENQFSPVGEQVAPVNNQFPGEQLAPTNNQVSPPGDQAAPVNNQYSPQTDQAAPVRHQTPPTGNQFTHNSQIPVESSPFAPDTTQLSPSDDRTPSQHPSYSPGNQYPSPAAHATPSSPPDAHDAPDAPSHNPFFTSGTQEPVIAFTASGHASESTSGYRAQGYKPASGQGQGSGVINSSEFAVQFSDRRSGACPKLNKECPPARNPSERCQNDTSCGPAEKCCFNICHEALWVCTPALPSA